MTITGVVTICVIIVLISVFISTMFVESHKNKLKTTKLELEDLESSWQAELESHKIDIECLQVLQKKFDEQKKDYDLIVGSYDWHVSRNIDKMSLRVFLENSVEKMTDILDNQDKYAILNTESDDESGEEHF